jgi:hypothetical protein
VKHVTIDELGPVDYRGSSNKKYEVYTMTIIIIVTV